jgi:CRISPR/Cas system-associated protein Csm6
MGGSKIVKNYLKEKEQIRNWMMKVKGGEFPEWYNSLDKEQKKMYAQVLEELKGEFRKPKERTNQKN